jgi:lycopene cyclase domain-containing protein
MSLYLILELIIIIIPLALSFDKKMRFYRRWKSVLISLVLVGSFFVTWDIIFTKSGIWIFNPAYHAGLVFFNLPLEEWLFFIVVPYASIFIHYSLEFVYPKLRFSYKITRAISFILIALFLTLAFLNTNKIYTLIVFLVASVAIIFGILDKFKILNLYFISFLVIMIPLLIFNGILTGTFIKNEVFAYNDSYNLGIRIFSMPVEDLVYGFSLILFNIMCIQKVESILKTTISININGSDNNEE